MANIVQLKRSSVAGKQPNVADLQVGELAVNLADSILYSKDATGNIIIVGSDPASGLTFSNTEPDNPNTGDVWIDSDTGTYYTYFNDGNSSQWVEIAASAVYTSNSAGGGGAVDLTSVSSDILPDTDITYDIGSPSLRFKDLYLSGNTINLGNALIQADATTGAVLIIPTPTDENPNPKATLVSPSGSITAVETSGGTVNTASITNISNTTSDAFYLNSNTISSNVTIPTGKNAMSAGPITIANGIEVTISSGSEWTVV